MKKILIISFLFFLVTGLFAQEKSSLFYEDRQKDFQYVPPIGTMIIYGGKLISEYYDEPELSADWGNRLYLHLYAGYESLGIFIEGLAEYQNNKFSEVNNWRENFGYDSQQYSLIQEKGKVYLNNWYILQRNLSYYFGPYLQTIRIGKLWVDFSPYTIYRTWGLEGVSFKGNIVSDVASYNIIYSFNKDVFANYKTFNTYTLETNNRHLIAGKFIYNNSKYLYGEAIGMYYNATDYKKEDVVSFKLGRYITDLLYVEGLDVEKHHNEIKRSEKFYGYFRKLLFDFNLVYINLKFYYRETSADFMTYNSLTWDRYEPVSDSIYDWIYEEERAIRNNEKAYNLELKYNLGGITIRNLFDWAQWLDKNRQDIWLITNPPGFRFQTDISYLIGWITVAHKFWQKEYYDSGSYYLYSPERLQIFTTELYIPLNNSINLVPRLEYFRKIRTSNVITDKVIQFLQINYSTAMIKFLAEVKISSNDVDEPAWLKAVSYYREQSWGIDNYVRLRMEYRF